MGRRTKLTKEFIQEAEELLREGHYAVTVSDYLGVSTATWHNWFNAGERLSKIEDDEELQYELKSNPHNPLYLSFFEAVKRATSRAEMSAVSLIKDHATKTWQAAAWYLERKHRDRWGRVTADDQKPVNHNALDDFLNQVDKIAQEPDTIDDEEVEIE